MLFLHKFRGSFVADELADELIGLSVVNILKRLWLLLDLLLFMI
jgi:hypothetical protein